MSYTLIGRLESRLGSSLPAAVAALALQRWWAIELAALMVVVGLILDVVAYHRAFPYQPGWAVLPLGALELGVVYAGMRLLGIAAPLGLALLLFGIGWLGALIFGQAVFPRVHLAYGEGGGELGRSGVAAGAVAAAILLVGLGAAYAVRPPTVHLHGVVRGPLVIRHAETLVGGVVRGGIVVRASRVTLRDVTVVGGENGIDVEDARHVVLDGVHVVRVALDGIHVRHSSVMIRDCSVASPGGPWVQGIDISFSMDQPMSIVSGCTISGGREGIVTHMSMVDVSDNSVSGTALRGITAGEMSMDMVHSNQVSGALGVGIFCVDHSECEIEGNTVAATGRDGSGDPTRAGVAIEAHYFAKATVSGNTIVQSPGGIGAFDNSTITRRREG